MYKLSNKNCLEVMSDTPDGSIVCAVIDPPYKIVADFFMSSGPTGIAALQTNRRFIGVELDPAYFAIAQERIAQALENKQK